MTKVIGMDSSFEDKDYIYIEKIQGYDEENETYATIEEEEDETFCVSINEDGECVALESKYVAEVEFDIIEEEEEE